MSSYRAYHAPLHVQIEGYPATLVFNEGLHDCTSIEDIPGGARIIMERGGQRKSVVVWGGWSESRWEDIPVPVEQPRPQAQQQSGGKRR